MSDFFADSLGFFDFPGKPPIADPDLKLNLVHATSCAPNFASMGEVIQEHRTFASELESQNLKIIRRADDLFMNGKTQVILGLQHLPDNASIETLFHIGIRIVCLSYHGQGAFGSGFNEPEKPLTKAGRRILEDCLKVGMIIDLSHLGHRSARDTLDFLEGKKGKPRVILSHSGCYGVFKHPRNAPDDIIFGVARMGGVIGVPSLTFLLDEVDNGLEPFFDHLRHSLTVAGPRAVCIGSDGWYKRLDPSEWQIATKELKAKLCKNGDSWNHRWPEQPLQLNSAERMTIVSEKIREFLPETSAQNILGLNLLNFMRENLP
ncbi:MAG: membrane dipeptidase [Patescibacteria group bacterium]